MSIFSTLCASVLLAACGTSADSGTNDTTAYSSRGGQAGDVQQPDSGYQDQGPVPVPVGGTITNIRVASSAAADRTSIPITFGQVFSKGAVAPTDTLVGKLDDGSVLPLQLNTKATHADGSVRHAVISAVLPALSAGQARTIVLTKGAGSTGPQAGVSLDALLNAGFTASVSVDLGGQTYAVSADALLKSGGYTTWISGPIAGEWMVSAPMKDAQGNAHPHLSARFAIRAYAGLRKARVDVTVENDWAYEPNPQNLTYDARVLVGGQTAYFRSGLKHFHHARWRKTLWWGEAPEVELQHDTRYLIASRAVPNYDTSVVVSADALADLDRNWSQSDTSPMGAGIVTTHMPTTGGRGDIGPLPQWGAMYLLSMDRRARKVTLGVGDLAGSWPIHYRDKNTGRPVSLNDYPYMTLLGRVGDTRNPQTGKYEWFPDCSGDCDSILHPDSAHQPSLAYLPYLVTGDYYYLEELHFWANWNVVRQNPEYRGYAKGLVRPDEVRAQAWSLRTLGHAAYITPDDHPMKEYFSRLVDNNLDWYNATFSEGNPNKLGVIDGSGDFSGRPVYETTPNGENTGISSWMDDFVTWSAGHLAELGFTKAQPFLAWKARYPVLRMTDPGYCWIDGAPYVLAIRPTANSPVYSTIGEAYRATLRKPDGSPLVNSTGAKYLDQPCGSQAQADWLTQDDRDHGLNTPAWVAGQMTGYADSPAGFPSNMQPALAVAATSGIPNAANAWNVFSKRSVKPDYSVQPQWNIIPRN
ncbi:hypothetical protein [Noviherbaspirillum massiliense]|uniref:RIFT barrel domain-containing protein n=1 Tax=Noviherbaspirillum massiliense TaxID=1465823 RepID=UPI000375EB79|nr:hypothetical protein [Noviherbaspirillum massiliense]